MSNSVSSLVLRNTHGSGVCREFDAGGQLPHQNLPQSKIICPCFTPGTLIKTDQGETPVENIKAGSRVLTRDNGYRTVVWSGRRRLSKSQLAEMPDLNPVRISRNSLGTGLPERDTVVSPQHRMLLCDTRVRDWFAGNEVLAAAHLLTCFQGIAREAPEEVTYIHFMFEEHEIVLANGVWTESFQPSDMRAEAMDPNHRAELLALFPELEDDAEGRFPPARKIVGAEQFTQELSQHQ